MSASVRPGDIVLVRKGEAVPADLVLLSSSNSDGTAYVRTANLDGEANLKLRRALPQTQAHTTACLASQDSEGDVEVSIQEVVRTMRLGCVAEAPNATLNSFNGKIVALDSDEALRFEDTDVDQHTRWQEAAEYVQSFRPENEDESVNTAPGSELGASSEEPGVPSTDVAACDISTLPAHQRIMPLTADCLLQRTCQLETGWILGLVVYCGMETKIFLNASRTPAKRSTLTRQVNRQILILFIIYAVLCLVAAGFNLVYTLGGNNHWYLDASADSGTSAVASFFISAFRFVNIYSVIVPISLFVSLDIIRIIIGLMMSCDRHFWSPDQTPEQRFTVANSSLLEELGYIDYLFTDKTGTLTENIMIADTFWAPAAGCWRTHCQRTAESEQPETPNGGELAPIQQSAEGRLVLEADTDSVVARALDSEPSEFPAELLEAIALCHEVNIDLSSGTPQYSAESPDEVALVELAAENGLRVLDRNKLSCQLEVAPALAANYSQGVRGAGDTTLVTFDVVAVFEFSSQRKRMSVVLRCPDGRLRVLMKGADSIVLPRCTCDSETLARANAVLDAASSVGLRTLCFSERYMDASEAASLQSAWIAASSIADAEEKANAQAQVAAQLEDSGHQLLGVSAIEDRLQDGVPRTLAFLRGAGVRPVMLTGDKLQTAVNIARSAQLIGASDPLVQLTGSDVASPADALPQLERALRELCGADTQFTTSDPKHHRAREALRRASSAMGDTYQRLVHPCGHIFSFEPEFSVRARPARCALVIDGEALGHVLEEPNATRAFGDLMGRVSSVIVCRASPLQKAQCVQLMRERGLVCAAVGDGANDVPMIQAASVGIGIAGREGLQAARSADFAIARFRYLARLIAVHGRYNYQRMSIMIQYSFYKNFIMAFASLLFGFLSQFSGLSVVSSYGLMFFNLFFTALPIVAVAGTSDDVPAVILEAVPQLYRACQRRTYMSMRSVFYWFLEALVSCVLIFTCFLLLYSAGGSVSPNGHTSGMGELQTGILAAVFWTVTLRCGIANKAWVWVFYACFGISIVLYFALDCLTSFIGEFAVIGVWFELYSPQHGALWLTVITAVALALFPGLICRFISRRYYPSAADVIVEAVRCRSRAFGIFKISKEDSFEERWAMLTHTEQPHPLGEATADRDQLV